MVTEFYKSLIQCLPNIPDLEKTIIKSVTEHEKAYIMENLYTADTWIFQTLLSRISHSLLSWHHKYSDYSIMGILASLKDTIFGFILYYTYLLDQAEKS